MTGAMGWRGWRPLGWGAAGAALLAPLIAMQVTDEVAWTAWPDARALILSPEVPGSTVVFTAMWLAAAWLFRKAGRG